ncbi:MAG: hypothetical protein H7A51_13895 [Akkermansiaceae bacterium]|nr:hypothetical protein [Akkermansiaceae bacterium]
MNAKNILSLLVGVLLGSGMTYFAVKSTDRENKVASTSAVDRRASDHDLTVSSSEDPFGDGNSEPSSDADDDDPFSARTAHGYGLMNMKDLSERALTISFWYHDQGTVVENLELHTGHKFNKKVGKIYASPIEILEEQLAFMKKFAAESDRIEKARVKQE